MVTSLISMLAVLLPLILTNNLVMSLVKYLSDKTLSVYGLRGALVLFSLIGVVSMAVLTGNAVDFNQVTDLLKMLVEVVAVAFASHYSYKAIKTA
jgi:hypothetical protein